MKKKIVVACQSIGYLMVDVVNAYAESYEKVVVLGGRVDTGDRNFAPNVIVKNIIRYNKSNIIKRILTWLLAALQITFKLTFGYRRYEVLYVTNPPMSYMARFFNKKSFSILIYDLYPNALTSIGINPRNFIYKFWKKINIKLFKKANKIFTLSEGMKLAISEYVDESKIKVVYNWPMFENLSIPNKIDNIFLNEYNLIDKFVIMYSGNIGQTHCVEKLVDVAMMCKEYRHQMRFVIIGEGMKKAMIENLVKEHNLNEMFLILPYQDNHILHHSLGAADVAVVTLDETSAHVSVPSKTYNLISLGIPILGISPKESEFKRIIDTYNCGRCFEKNEIESIAIFIKECMNNRKKLTEYHENALRASANFTKKNAYLYVED